MGCTLCTATKFCAKLVPSCCRHKLVSCLTNKDDLTLLEKIQSNIMRKKLEEQTPCTRENGFVSTQSLIFGGLVGNAASTKALMFVRPKVVEMWNELEKMQPSSKQLHVCGPPGTGKSTVAWAWACFTAQQKNVVWVNVDKFRQRLTIYYFFNQRMQSFEGITEVFKTYWM